MDSQPLLPPLALRALLTLIFLTVLPCPIKAAQPAAPTLEQHGVVCSPEAGKLLITLRR